LISTFTSGGVGVDNHLPASRPTGERARPTPECAIERAITRVAFGDVDNPLAVSRHGGRIARVVIGFNGAIAVASFVRRF